MSMIMGPPGDGEEHYDVTGRPPLPERADRGRDTSPELTDVRRVLGTARNALAHLLDMPRYRADARKWWADPANAPHLSDEGRAERIADLAEDPDHAAMVRELTHVVRLLSRWERTGRTRAGE